MDFDHSPSRPPDPDRADFCTAFGMHRIVRYLRGGGVFALTSDDPPDERYVA